MSRRRFLEPREREIVPLPAMFTHAQWCQWLFSRGTLKPEHRACMTADGCRATWGATAEWKAAQRKDA